MTRDSDDVNSIRHDDVPTLANNAESSFLKRRYRAEMMDTGKFWHLLRDNLNFPNLAFRYHFIHCRQILVNRILNIFDGFGFCVTLRPATGQSGARNSKAFF